MKNRNVFKSSVPVLRAEINSIYTMINFEQLSLHSSILYYQDRVPFKNKGYGYSSSSLTERNNNNP